MAHEILVPTDLSNNSKAGLRFAIQLGLKLRSKLVFYHAMHEATPTTLSPEGYSRLIDQRILETRPKVEEFVRRTYQQMGLNPKKLECIVEFKLFADSAIVDYAVFRKVSYICMSTRGAGQLRRILGTNTSEVLIKSPVPVLVIPDSYRRSPVSHVLYASDLTALAGELKQVAKFTHALKAKLSVVHYHNSLDPAKIEQKFEQLTNRYKRSLIEFHLERHDPGYSMEVQLKKSVQKFKPSLLALFTNQNRSWLERLFTNSNSTKLSFDGKKPILVFPKQM